MGVKGMLALMRTERGRRQYEQKIENGCQVDDLHALIADGRKFAVIYADPPWEFQACTGKSTWQQTGARYYDAQSLDVLKALPVKQLAAKDCALFLWAVTAELPAALEVIKAWGFEYITVGFVWVKQNRSGDGLFTGLGAWTRANAELCLLAKRGTPRRMAMDVHQVVMAPVGEHSVKPEEVRARIERLVDGPYLEMFGRESVPGWTVYGNEISREEWSHQCQVA